MLLTEKFHSLQGEGYLTGEPMYFIRTNLCNLRCTWCDTTYSFENGKEESLDTLVQECVATWENWICFTGGEPMLQREALEFMRQVTASGKKILLETGGSMDISKVTMIEGTMIDMDVKCPSSKEEKSIKLSNLQYLRREDYCKFVIQDKTDFEYADSFIKSHRMNCGLIFQPAWGIESKWIADEIMKRKLPVRLMIQTHKIVFGEGRGV